VCGETQLLIVSHCHANGSLSLIYAISKLLLVCNKVCNHGDMST